ncbi:hypothetical protein PAHAL_9G523400 [Panicum hallii]|uniref:Uncharacterized protein n=1 Tax=Panicum hallii TaxID=206008 RepID=A0A2T8I5H5_9POAL|nr:hypothetical protein PAHAL_9G523400 [Panicum hallii]
MEPINETVSLLSLYQKFLFIMLFMIKIRLSQKQIWSSHDRARCQILNPSALRHCRWASMNFPQASSPFCTMQSSLSFFVSGQAQQIFFFVLVSGAGAVVAGGSAEAEGCAAAAAAGRRPGRGGVPRDL